jgi:opacity protein-like surface antigen
MVGSYHLKSIYLGRGEWMKVKRIIGIGVMVAALALPGAGMAAMWAGGQVGANFMANADQTWTIDSFSETLKNAKYDPAVLGGITLGYDFVKTGFLGYNWPDWMRYFSFAVDFTYNGAQARQQNVDLVADGVVIPKQFITMFRQEFRFATLSFLFMAKYGFLCDSEVPFGRIIPYVAVGPGVLFSSIQTNIQTDNSASSTDIALVAEAGVRFMCLKNVSLDTAFRYRMAQPSYIINVNGGSWKAELDANQFTALFRANYHF